VNRNRAAAGRAGATGHPVTTHLIPTVPSEGG